tara:strand:- start:38 stop:475 length:438 start_codon:yes stop_codon:yes gene_type:complete
MKDEFIQNLPDDIKSRIFIEVCGKLRERRFRETFPHKEIQNELLADKFHNRKKIQIDDMDILVFKATLSCELDKYVDNINYSDFEYYRATTTRFYINKSKEYIQVCGYSGQYEIKEFICEHCNTNSIILSHKRKTYICKHCNIEY